MSGVVKSFRWEPNGVRRDDERSGALAKRNERSSERSRCLRWGRRLEDETGASAPEGWPARADGRLLRESYVSEIGGSETRRRPKARPVAKRDPGARGSGSARSPYRG